LEKISKLKFIDLIKIVFVILCIAGCANQLSPGGGKVDKVPPEIINVNPPNETVNFTGNSIEFTFSEYVDKSSVKSAVFISPKIEGTFEYDWSGRTLEIVFPDSLRENTTYIFTIGTDVVDNNNKNRMAKAFTYRLSTGDEIFNGKITGKVYDDNPDGTFIFAYKVDSVEVNPIEEKPLNITQIGENGEYELLGLSPGKYNIYAVNDSFKDLLYNVESDFYGVQDKEIMITKELPDINDLNFKLTSEDTTKPFVLSTTMVDRYHILIEYNEHIDSTKITTDDFFIIDSTNNSVTNFRYYYKNDLQSQKAFLVLNDTLQNTDDKYLITNNITDYEGNISDKDEIRFMPSDRIDTAKVKVNKVITEFTGNQIDFDNPWVLINFDDGFEQNNLQNTIKFSDETKSYSFAIDRIDDGTIKINVKDKLKSDSRYKVEIDLSNIVDIEGNVIDSVYTINVSTINAINFSGAFGRIITTSKDSLNYYTVLENLSDKKIKLVKKVKRNLTFEYDRVFPGQYLLWSFIDKDSNGVFSYGKIYPFEQSEPFVYYPDTLELKARWPVGDIEVVFN
jgi:hypothetical protein